MSAVTELRLDRLFDEVKELVPLDGIELLTPSTVHGVVTQSSLGMRPQQALRNGYVVSKAQPGDFVISMSSHAHGIEYCGISGGISPDYTLLRPKCDPALIPFLRYALKSKPIIHQMGIYKTGVRMGLRLQWNKVRYCKIAVPDAEVASATAAFLDNETRRIDSLIEKKIRFSQLIRERTDALIDSVISNNDLERVRFGNLAHRVERRVSLSDQAEFTRLGLLNRGRGTFRKPAADEEEMGDSTFYTVKDGDLIISGQFAWEGAVAMATYKEDGCVVSHRYPIYRAIDGIKTEYLLAFFRSNLGTHIFNETSRGSAGRNRPLNASLLEKEKIPVPDLNFQEVIARAILFERHVKRMMDRSIELLKEHRSALITAAVTGKIDARDHASQNLEAAA